MGHAIRALAPDHLAAQGHFPGNPIIPGAYLLQLVANAITEGSPGLHCTAITSAKFLHPVRPGDRIRIDWQSDDTGQTRFDCIVLHADANQSPRAVTGVIRLGPA